MFLGKCHGNITSVKRIIGEALTGGENEPLKRKFCDFNLNFEFFETFVKLPVTCAIKYYGFVMYRKWTYFILS